MIPKINYSDPNSRKSDYLKNIGTITYYNNFAFIDIEEGTHIGFIEMEKIDSLVSHHFKNRSYSYLCNRNISYSVNPMTYSTLSKIDKLKSIAILREVTNSHDLEVEKHFFNKPFEIFNTFESASEWIDNLK